MTEMHPIVLATIETNVAKARLTVAQLESKARTVPATRRSSNDMLRLMRQTNEAQAVLNSWLRVSVDATRVWAVDEEEGK